MAEDAAGQVGHADADAGRAQVGDQHVTGVGPEGQLAGRATAGARPHLALGDETAIEQVLHAAGDDRPAEAGSRAKLGT